MHGQRWRGPHVRPLDRAELSPVCSGADDESRSEWKINELVKFAPNGAGLSAFIGVELQELFKQTLDRADVSAVFEQFLQSRSALSSARSSAYHRSRARATELSRPERSTAMVRFSPTRSASSTSATQVQIAYCISLFVTLPQG